MLPKWSITINCQLEQHLQENNYSYEIFAANINEVYNWISRIWFPSAVIDVRIVRQTNPM